MQEIKSHWPPAEDGVVPALEKTLLLCCHVITLPLKYFLPSWMVDLSWLSVAIEAVHTEL